MNRFPLAAFAASLALFTTAPGAYAASADAAAKIAPGRGKEIATTLCAACHSADGNSVIPGNPKLAGQGAGYLYKQLSNFKAADGKAPERVNPIMNGMVAALSDADMKSIAAYYAAQKQVPAVAKNRETADYARQLYRAGDQAKGLPACAGCHGPSGAGVPKQYPRLAGQFPEYTETQLRSFRSAERSNDSNKMMRSIALKMTDPEIKALADYIAGLR